MVIEIRELRKEIQKADKVIKQDLQALVAKYGYSIEEYLESAKREFQYSNASNPE